MKRLLPFAIIIIVLGAGLVLGMYLEHSAEKSEAVSISTLGQPGAPGTSANIPNPGAEPEHVRGPVQAPVTLEEFADFQCPACGNFYSLLRSIEGEYGTRVRFIFREFPLTAMHVHANAAAQAAEAAGLQGKFWEMHDLLYENRTAWINTFDVRPVFEDYARKIGLDVAQFKQDQSSELVASRISQDRGRAQSLRIKSTPTLFINGVEIPYHQMKTIEALRMILDKQLSQTGQLP